MWPMFPMRKQSALLTLPGYDDVTFFTKLLVECFEVEFGIDEDNENK